MKWFSIGFVAVLAIANFGLANLFAGVASRPSPKIEASADRPKESSPGHWAFNKLLRPAVPQTQTQGWVRTPIDAFILARLERENLAPSSEADRRTLIRRLSFDLVGLPPRIEEVEAFLADQRSGAYESLVDRLLASPHFGERWGRHWLDLARYADSDGYEKDTARPYAYLYRDWVLDAINRDLPFDQFSIEQLAGDLLPDATEEQRIATGFHRNTLTNKEGGVDQEEFRCKATVDRVNTTSTVWLGLTVGCAECHNHKYDPISQQEFYQMYAFFNNASEKDLPVPRPAELAKYQREKRRWEADREQLKIELDAYLKAELAKFYPEEIDLSARGFDKRLADQVRKEPKYPATKAQTLSQNEKPRTTHIHIRGDFLRRGSEVEPGTPEVLHRFAPRSRAEKALGGASTNPPLHSSQDGKSQPVLNAKLPSPDRLDLAKWLFDPANPLTARVAANQIWTRLFGRGLVSTPDDFGTRGEKPSHPELLDWLATEFQKLGWSRKAFIKGIVMSSAYRQSSQPRPELADRDPNNVLLARQNRMRIEAEAVRDSFLSVSGLLNPTLGGPGIRPPLPADIAALGYANSVKWKESEGAERYRRGLYIHFQRTVPYPMLMTFDAPDSNVTCTRRERSNTPLQALALLNDPAFFECAQALGLRLATEPATNASQKIKRAFELCLSRPPTDEEGSRLMKFYEDSIELARQNPKSAARIVGTEGNTLGAVEERAAMIAVARTILNLDEFVTRE